MYKKRIYYKTRIFLLLIFNLHFMFANWNFVDDDIHLNSRTFILPTAVEEVLDMSAARLSAVRDNLEYLLRYAVFLYNLWYYFKLKKSY